MLFDSIKIERRELILIVISTLFCIIISLIPPLESRTDNSIRVEVSILEVDNSEIEEHGIVKTGNQHLTARILEGEHKNEIIECSNQLTGRMEMDKLFTAGDNALGVVNISTTTGEIISSNITDHYRIRIELVLVTLFFLLLILYAGWTGIKAILSFYITGVTIWKILLPLFLKGYNPILISMAVVIFLTLVIINLISGINKRGLIASLGAITGVIATSLIAIYFSNLFNIHGAVKPFAETLLYSGYADLDITGIFIASIFISASGAIMDIAIDISASQQELIIHNPKLTSRELIRSGFNIGRTVIGTMTTTLLLAYSGGFTALLMVFIAQGTPTINILNINYVAAEILHTIVGSFGLVLVAPLTAIIGGIIYTRAN